MISDDLSKVIDGIKIPMELKNEIQRSIHGKPEGESDNIQETSAMVDVLSKVVTRNGEAGSGRRPQN